ncbi:MAG: hypothetical protein IJ168_00260 [Eubacterium sp.]|nr:hypothetical protein [Eubacterium sp.]
MGISATRRILSTVLSVLLAIAMALLISMLAMNVTLSNRTYLEQNFVTDELATACTDQLEVKYTVLEEETGIPSRVFMAVTEENPVRTTLSSVFQNAFGAEDTLLYNDNMVDYFENLCTEYLDESGARYEEADVHRAADKAAVIYGETVGLHEVESVSSKVLSIRHRVSGILALAAGLAVLSALLITLLYSDRKKAAVYLCSGAAAGSFGILLGAAVCLLLHVNERILLSPAVYQAVAAGLVQKYFSLLLAVGLVLSVLFYVLLVTFVRQQREGSSRSRRS